ncbi:hypothetical protein DRF65_02110 [Chryseobacterium pennae]|uniref:Uncharacterized protein n=1 Tax=Chryseobacterium pennae TaxID=2258962 RepID=A0A3D9CF39_9FLAO|nr:hypothetical protein [Chryseobacterium pennae]REC64389.1 hypothetical protein DRF65_02110 [Chryseobacterium pennae]
MSNVDFNVNREFFLEKFKDFLEKWLQEFFELKQSLSFNSIESIFNTVKMSNNKYEEFFSFYNFYKKLIESKDDILFFYDSQSKTPHEHFKRYVD